MKFLTLLLIIFTTSVIAQDKSIQTEADKKATAEFVNKFSHESSLSVVQTGGNAVSESYSFDTTNIFTTEPREYKFYGNYVLSYADDPEVQGIDTQETARNWQVGAATVFKIVEKVGINTGIMFEGNEFAGIKQRENLDLGTKYQINESDKLKSYVQVGYRYVIEKRVSRDENNEDVFYFNKANVYYQIEQQLNENVSYKFWVQYLPNFTEGDDYQINFEPSMSVVMSTNLSLKVAYKGQYDNELNPGVEEYLDHTTTTSLVAKF